MKIFTCWKAVSAIKIIFFFLLIVNTRLFAQKPTVSLEVKDAAVDRVLLDLAAEYRYDILFHESYFENQKLVTVSFRQLSINQALKRILKNTDIDFYIVGQQIKLIRKRTLYGYVQDAETHEGLVNAAIYHPELQIGTYTNENGYFSLTLPYEVRTLQVQYIGYENHPIEIGTTKGEISTIYLEPFSVFEPILVVPKDTDSEQGLSTTGEDVLPAQILGHLSAGGEPDINQHLFKQTGVSSGPDGLGGLHVRGGSSDQNLILLDGVRVFQPNHAFGLFSVFNTSLLKNANFSKYNFDPKYGGGVSSVLEMTLKEGSTKKWNGNFSVSTLASQVSINGPVFKDKTSVLFSFRRSHIDPFVKKISEENKAKLEEYGNVNYYFNDFHVKLRHRFSSQDNVYLSYYKGQDFYKDKYGFDDDGIFRLEGFVDRNQHWSNEIASLKWTHLFGDQLFSSAIFSFSEMRYANEIYEEILVVQRDPILVDHLSQRYNFYTGTVELGFRYDFEYYPSDRIKNSFGLSYYLTTFLPGAFNSDNESSMDSIVAPVIPEFDFIFKINSYKQNNASLYFNQGRKLSDQWQLNYGGRYSLVKSENVLDDVSSIYHLWNARFAIAYSFNKKMSLQLSGSKSDQAIHLLSPADVGLPNDLWVPAIEGVKPQTAWESNMRYRYHLNEHWSLQSSVFYKKMNHLIQLPNSFSLPSTSSDLTPDFWESEIVAGHGNSKGIELDLTFRNEKVEVDMAYTLSKYQRRFPEVNDGATYPFRFDQRHNLSVSGKIDLSKNISFYTNFLFNNGLNQTLYEGGSEVFPLSGNSPDFFGAISKINADQLPAYHRLDIGFVFNFGNKIKQELVLGVQNVLNKKNIYFRYKFYPYVLSDGSTDTDSFLTKSVKALPILPLVKYKFIF